MKGVGVGMGMCLACASRTLLSRPCMPLAPSRPQIEYSFPFTLIVCYNTPRQMSKEAELARLDGKVYPNGRTLRILRVEGSTSKAQNLNMALVCMDEHGHGHEAMGA